MTCFDVLSAMRTSRGEQLATRNEQTRGEVYKEFLRIEHAEATASGSVTIRELVLRMERQGHEHGTQDGKGPKRTQKQEHGNERSMAE
jgi:hypothetical protein